MMSGMTKRIQEPSEKIPMAKSWNNLNSKTKLYWITIQGKNRVHKFMLIQTND